MRSKAAKNFCPLGSFIDTDFNPTRGAIWSDINNISVQKADLSDMLFSVTECLALLSNIITLFPGDVVLFGTPEGAGADARTGLSTGDHFRLHIDGLDDQTQIVV